MLEVTDKYPTEISKLITQMRQPSFYPHAVNENIELVQTHASLVFLTGDYAYKVKKSVDFGFLNYSTLDKRKRFVEAELRLNKQIAPELYLEVVKIGSKARKLMLDGAGRAKNCFNLKAKNYSYRKAAKVR